MPPRTRSKKKRSHVRTTHPRRTEIRTPEDDEIWNPVQAGWSPHLATIAWLLAASALASVLPRSSGKISSLLAYELPVLCVAAGIFLRIGRGPKGRSWQLLIGVGALMFGLAALSEAANVTLPYFILLGVSALALGAVLLRAVRRLRA